MPFLFKDFVQFDTDHNAVHYIFTQKDFLQANLCQPKRGWPVLLCVLARFAGSLLVLNIYIGATILSKVHLKVILRLPGSICLKIKKCAHFKAHPVGNIADQMKRSWCLLERCLSSVFQHTHPFRKQPEAVSTHVVAGKHKQIWLPTLKHKQMDGSLDRETVPSLKGEEIRINVSSK